MLLADCRVVAVLPTLATMRQPILSGWGPGMDLAFAHRLQGVVKYCIRRHALPEHLRKLDRPLDQKWMTYLNHLADLWYEQQLLAYQPELPLQLVEVPAELKPFDRPRTKVAFWADGAMAMPAGLLGSPSREHLTAAVFLRYRLFMLEWYGKAGGRLLASLFEGMLDALTVALAEDYPAERLPGQTPESSYRTWQLAIEELAVLINQAGPCPLEGLFQQGAI